MSRFEKIRAWWNSPPTTTTLIVMLVLITAFYAFLAVFVSPAFAAIHTDKPTQETTPVASKDQTSSCFQSNAVITFLRDEQGNWHRLTVYGPIEPCGH